MIKLKRKKIVPKKVVSKEIIVPSIDPFDYDDDDEDDSEDYYSDDEFDYDDDEEDDDFTQMITNAPVVDTPNHTIATPPILEFINQQIFLLEEGLDTLNEEDKDDIYNISLVINNLRERFNA